MKENRTQRPARIDWQAIKLSESLKPALRKPREKVQIIAPSFGQSPVQEIKIVKANAELRLTINPAPMEVRRPDDQG